MLIYLINWTKYAAQAMYNCCSHPELEFSLLSAASFLSYGTNPISHTVHEKINSFLYWLESLQIFGALLFKITAQLIRTHHYYQIQSGAFEIFLLRTSSILEGRIEAIVSKDRITAGHPVS